LILSAFSAEHGGTIKLQSIIEFNTANRFSFDPISAQTETTRLNKNDQKLRLGALLVQKGVLTPSQLEVALSYQNENHMRLGEALVSLNYVTPSILKKALIKQSWLKTVATVGAFVLAPILSSNCFASDYQKASTIKVASIEKPRAPFKEDMQASFTPRSIGDLAKAYYFSGHETKANGDNVFFIIGRKLSETAGVNISLFSRPTASSASSEWQLKNEGLDQDVYPESNFLLFDPQISLFKFSVKPNLLSFNKPKIRNGNRYTNTIPAVIMLTLKGRSIYETAGDQTRLWSLNRAKKGVQRKAHLMLSITKQF